MKEHDPLEETLAWYRETVPPEGVRDSNRQAVWIALEQTIAAHWWRRSITVPLPAVLATAAALLISLSIHLISAQGTGELSEPDSAAVLSGGDNNTVSTLIASADPHVEYSETQRYLSGVGVIDRDIFYQIKE